MYRFVVINISYLPSDMIRIADVSDGIRKKKSIDDSTKYSVDGSIKYSTVGDE